MSPVPKRQVRLGAHFPGVNNTTVWADPRSGSHIDFASFVHLAQTAERAKFDFLFLAEGLRLREKKGLIHDLDVVGRPDTLTVLAGLAAVTERLGLIGTISATYNEPYEVARQFASLDQLSGGRAGWNVVTSSDAFTGENFRRGGYLPYDRRYDRATEFLAIARELWNSWPADAIPADAASGRFLAGEDAGRFAHRGEFFDVEGRFSVPRTPQVEPVILQAGDSQAGRDFGARHGDGIFTLPRPIEEARAFYREVKGRLAAHGRHEDDLLLLPAATFVIGDTHAEAEERAAEIRTQQVSGATAIQLLEAVWNRDLTAYDPDGPLPDIEPLDDGTAIQQGQARRFEDRQEKIREWRARAEAGSLSIRDIAIEDAAWQTFVGTPAEIAEEIDLRVQTRADDGFILVPHITPAGLDEFADRVVPELQERGSFRREYEGTTLRDHLGLPPAGTRRPAVPVPTGVPA
ncbi:NtaA/DmoA family FMN-dependent monooxygenase [Patulibacter sp. NPDC049589]|uniref:NtaA/DmoA family FMN-dependent monooxygenase n=1 Tax=Patulibacter sp. NPDC049589 TaxID=3154731 RepID=UPI00342B8A2F